MPQHPLIRTIYLYLFALVGLILLTVGGIGFLNMALKAFLFTDADKERILYDERPPIPFKLQTLERMTAKDELTEDEATRLRSMLEDYEAWEQRRKEVDPVKSRRHREAAENLAFLLVGLPLYLYHWRQIRSDVTSNPVG